MAKHALFALLAAAVLCTTTAQLACSGVLSSPPIVTSDVSVTGVACTISGITVTGSVQVSGGGSLTTAGTVIINGGIESTDSSTLTLDGDLSVSGSVSLSGGSISLGSTATVTSIGISDGGTALISGTTGDLGATGGGAIEIRGGTILGGGLLVEMGTGEVLLCNANVTGGIGVIERTGDLRIAPGPGCAPSAVIGSIGVEKGTGDIILGGAGLGADLEVVEQVGDVIATNVAFSDLKIEKSTGDVILSAITTDSDVSIVEHDGPVTLLNSVIAGDFSVNGATAATITGNKFSNESFSLSAITGPVVVSNNMEFSANIIENPGSVDFTGNDASVVAFSSNTGGVSIVDNTIITLSCSSNTPPPTGSGNTITGIADGQCVAL